MGTSKREFMDQQYLSLDHLRKGTRAIAARMVLDELGEAGTGKVPRKHERFTAGYLSAAVAVSAITFEEMVTAVQNLQKINQQGIPWYHRLVTTNVAALVKPGDEVISRGECRLSYRTYDTIQADVAVTSLAAAGAEVLYATGSARHNIKMRGIAKRLGMKLTRHGLERGDELVSADEAGIFAAIGMDYVRPEDR